MQTKHPSPVATRKMPIVVSLSVIALLSLGTVSFLSKKKLQNDRPQASIVTPTARTTNDSSIASSGAPPGPLVQSAPASPSAVPQAKQPRGLRIIPLRFEEFDQRILLSPREIATVQIETGAADDALVRVDAPNGGTLNQHKAPAVLSALELARGIRFAVGPTRGLYTLEVNRDGQTRIFEFWVDRESPPGQPGPERTFVH